MKRIAAAAVLGLAVTALPLAAGTASASASVSVSESASVTCGNYWTQGAAGPNARDYYWGNCGSAAMKIEVWGLAYGGGVRSKWGEKCVPADTAVLLGQTTQYLVTSVEGVDKHTAC